MNLLIKGPRGTQDILPKDSYKWKFIEDIMFGEAKLHGFKEIRTPVFEHTELFNRSVGEDTDVVQKEMYTFNDKGGRSITLKPEGTAGAVRAMLEHGLYNDPLPVKLAYVTPCYRYEKPQSGRYREFHQFGVEMFGAGGPAADAQVITMAKALFERLGIENLNLEINSIGCKDCRKRYYEALRGYFSASADGLCETCKSRMERNPMRILDCKNETCKEIAKGAPKILNYICDDCRAHFEQVKEYLDAAEVQYTVNPTIVRGLDYYTRTVFEFVSAAAGTQGVVCGGGGRYDGLVEELGGNPMPAVGFGMGMERLILVMETQGIEIERDDICDVYIASMDETSAKKAFKLAKSLRESSFIVETDLAGRSFRAQMKYADKICAKLCIVLGQDEINSGKAKVKNMKTGEQVDISLKDSFLNEFFDIYTRFENPELLSLVNEFGGQHEV